jgi:surface protein
VNGVMGDWDITRVTILSNLFEGKKNFRADISKWNTKRVVDMSESTCASVAV